MNTPDLKNQSKPLCAEIIAVSAVMIIAAIFRFYHLGSQSLWLDEAYSYRYSRLDWHELLFNLSTYETHPPFYYSLLKIWSGIFGYSEFAMRSLSTLASLASITLIYMSAKLVSNKDNGWKMGLLAALMLALSPLQLAHAQNARPYAFYTLAMALSTFCLCWLWSRRDKLAKPLKDLKIYQPRAIIIYIGLGLGVALLQWLHNTAITFIFTITLCALWLWVIVCKANRSIFSGLIISGLCAFLFYAPYLPQFWGQLHSFSSGDFWLKAPSPPYLLAISMILFGITQQWFSLMPWFNVFLLTILPLIGLGIWSFLQMHKNISLSKNPVWLLLILSILPWLANIFITYEFHPIFMDRLLIPLQFSWFILLSAAPFALKGWKKSLTLCLFIGLILAQGVGYHTYRDGSPHNVARWEEIFQRIVKESGGKPTIITISEFPEIPLSYYADKLHVTPNIIVIQKENIDSMSKQAADDLLRPLRGQKIIWVSLIAPYNKPPKTLSDTLLKDYSLSVTFPVEGNKEEALFKYTLKH